MTGALTGLQVLIAASEELNAGGYRAAVEMEDTAGTPVRFFEDEYSIVALAFYDSWQALSEQWPSAQGLVVEVMSTHLNRSEAKSWEGYLVLLTTDEPVDDPTAVDRIRRDTSRLRKLVVTGKEITGLESVAAALLPVLPLSISAETAEAESVLDRLPDLMAAEGVDREMTRGVVRAFEGNKSPMEAIWQWRQSQ